MAALSHVILHLTLCNAVAQATPKTPVAVRVKLFDRIGQQTFVQTYQIAPEDMDKWGTELAFRLADRDAPQS